MSWDIDLTDPVTGETLRADYPHQMKGGTYVMGGTDEMTLNVTYNYSPQFHRVMEGGIESLHDKTGAKSIPMLTSAINGLGNEVDPDYWKATDGNAKRALHSLLAFAYTRPDGVWKVA